MNELQINDKVIYRNNEKITRAGFIFDIYEDAEDNKKYYIIKCNKDYYTCRDYMLTKRKGIQYLVNQPLTANWHYLKAVGL